MRRKLFQRQKIYFSESRQRAENFNLGPLKDLDSLIDEILALADLATFQVKTVTFCNIELESQFLHFEF